MHVSLIWPSHQLTFRTCLTYPLHPPQETWPCDVALANLIYHTGKLQSGGYCVSLVVRRPESSCAAIFFPFHTTVIPCSSFSQQAGLSERSRLAVLIVPFYPNPHMKLIYTLPSSEQGYYVCRVQPKSEPCRSFARGISCTFRILRWFLRRLCDRRMVSIPCMILKGRYM